MHYSHKEITFIFLLRNSFYKNMEILHSGEYSCTKSRKWIKEIGAWNTVWKYKYLYKYEDSLLEVAVYIRYFNVKHYSILITLLLLHELAFD